jgi:hypothetical protein
MAVNRCPFCGNYAHSKSVGDAYHLDCSYCEVQIEISKKAYAVRCEDPEATLASVYAKLAWSKRPRIDLADMKARVAVPAALASAGEENMAKTEEPPGLKKDLQNDDAITAAAKAIGSTLGKLAVKTGIAKQPPAPAKKPGKKPAAKKVPAQSSSAKTSSKAKTKTKSTPKKAPRKPSGRKT